VKTPALTVVPLCWTSPGQRVHRKAATSCSAREHDAVRILSGGLLFADRNTSASRLLLRTRFGRNHPGQTIVDNELAIVFTGVFDETVGHVGNTDLLMAVGIDDEI